MTVPTEIWGVARVQPDGSLRHVEMRPLETSRDAARTLRIMLADDFSEAKYVLTRSEVLPPREVGTDDPADTLHEEIKAAIHAEWQKLAADNTTGDPADFAHLFATAALTAIRNGAPDA